MKVEDLTAYEILEKREIADIKSISYLCKHKKINIAVNHAVFLYLPKNAANSSPVFFTCLTKYCIINPPIDFSYLPMLELSAYKQDRRSRLTMPKGVR